MVQAESDIRHYMLQVREYLRHDGTPPMGYDEEDRDSGYRSALRFHGIERTSETDKLASHLIYRRDLA